MVLDETDPDGDDAYLNRTIGCVPRADTARTAARDRQESAVLVVRGDHTRVRSITLHITIGTREFRDGVTTKCVAQKPLTVGIAAAPPSLRRLPFACVFLFLNSLRAVAAL